jgi:ribonuclease HII
MSVPTRIVGIDEAGRGSFLGPLVVGGFAVEPGRVEELRGIGVRDSKELTPAVRERVYLQLGSIGAMRSLSLPPSEIDRAVAHRLLNELEATAFGRLVRDLRATEARVDACDPDERRFGRRVAHHAGYVVRVVARHHADRDDPVVGAASIVAKVRRDRAIARLALRLRQDIGSGYPSDPTTVAFVRKWLRDRPGHPAWLRKSWSTMKRVNGGPPAVTLERFGA